MDRLASEITLLSAPPACLSVSELRRAVRLARALGRTLAGRPAVDRARVSDYLAMGVTPAQETGLLTEAGQAHWSQAADLDVRFVAFQAAFALARAGA